MEIIGPSTQIRLVERPGWEMTQSNKSVRRGGTHL